MCAGASDERLEHVAAGLMQLREANGKRGKNAKSQAVDARAPPHSGEPKKIALAF